MILGHVLECSRTSKNPRANYHTLSLEVLDDSKEQLLGKPHIPCFSKIFPLNRVCDYNSMIAVTDGRIQVGVSFGIEKVPIIPLHCRLRCQLGQHLWENVSQ